MPIAVNQHRQEQPSMIRGLSCIPSFAGTNEMPNALSKQFEAKSSSSPDIIDSLTWGGGNIKDTNWTSCCSSSSSSSIGQNSNSGNFSTLTGCNEDGSGGDMEVQSSYKGPLDTLTALEDSLPIKRGISSFFSGKSRSFTSLSDAVPIKDLAKPENAYNKKRRNLLTCGSNWDKYRFCSRNGSSGISKKTIHSSKSTLALAVAMNNSQNNSQGYKHDLQTPPLPPLHPQVKSYSSADLPRSFSVRSFSLTDLQGISCQPNFARI